MLESRRKKGPLTEQAYLDALAAIPRLTTHRRHRRRDAQARIGRHRRPLGWPGLAHRPVNGDAHGGGDSSPAAVSGYPSITVPAGYVWGLPVGISFTAGAYAEPTLIRLAYAFEQATQARRSPDSGRLWIWLPEYLAPEGWFLMAQAEHSYSTVFVGPYTWTGIDPTGKAKGLYVYRLSAATGALEPAGVVPDVVNPSFLAVDPDGEYLYAANEEMAYGGQPGGALSAFTIDGPSGVPVRAQSPADRRRLALLCQPGRGRPVGTGGQLCRQQRRGAAPA